MKTLAAALLLSFLALSADAVEVLQAKRLPPATLLELAARTDVEPKQPREVRHEKRPRRTSARHAPSAPQRRPVRTTATIAAPPVVAGFASATSRRIAPADSSGAVSRTHVVGAFNTGLVVQSRGGAKIVEVSLGQFWADKPASDLYYDPRIAYDSISDRWVTIALNDGHTLMLAVSHTADPTGAWTRYSLPLGATGGEIDFTRLALTRDSVSIVTERVDYASCLMVVTQKADLYAGAEQIPVRVVDSRGSSSQAVPVASNDSDVEYFIKASDIGVMDIKRFEDEQWGDMLSRYTWEPGWFFAKQRSTGNDLDFGFDEVQNAVLRDGTIYAAHTIGIPDTRPTRSAVMWWTIDASRRRVTGQGIIDDGKTFYGYPSVAVNRTGMLIAYAATSSAEYPSARYVFIDALGNVSSEGTLVEGTTSIRDTDRWGDYTTAVADPADDASFWTIQLYAKNDAWATWWAQVKGTVAPTKRRGVRH